MTGEPHIRPATPADADAVTRIYNHYVTTTVVTFEEEAVAASEIAGRMAHVGAASLPWLVAERDARVVGYAYASPWHTRAAYRHSVEITVYLEPGQTRLGLGSRLYDRLFPLLLERGVHAAVGGIALPNDASVALHQKFGLVKAGHFREVGFKFGRWVDVGYWQRTF